MTGIRNTQYLETVVEVNDERQSDRLKNALLVQSMFDLFEFDDLSSSK